MTARRGIRTRNRAGAFGTHMWSRRWIADLEAGAAPREARQARVDARVGKVLSLEHSGRVVRCDVAGSRPEPFTAEFAFAELDGPDAEALRRELRSGEGGVLAALAGRYSDRVGFLLVPAVEGATRFSCPCPVQPGPCRHVVAAGCVVVEWWDRSPEALFGLRGLGADVLGASPGASGEALAVDVEEALWGEDPLLPVVPDPAPAGLEDLLDAPVARRMAAAATRDPLEQMRVVADLEDFLDAFGRYRAR